MRRVFSTIAWLGRVVRHLVVSQPVATLSGIGMGFVAHIANILAFLLPLKVILLAGAGGIPKYFRPFMGQEDKPAAIVLLSVGAVLCYVLSIYLDGVVRRLSTGGSERILEDSNPVSIVNNQVGKTSDLYLSFVLLTADALFVALVFGVLAWLNPLLFGCISAGVAFSFLYLLRSPPSGGIDRVWQQEMANKLSVLTSLTFFFCFAVVLMPFVLGTPGRNILVAIISFVLVRRVLSVLPRLVGQIVKLVKDRQMVNALVFPDHRLPRRQGKAEQMSGPAFEKPARTARVRAELERLGLISEDAKLDVSWLDPESGDSQTFEVRVWEPGNTDPTLYLKRVISSGKEFRAENEKFLFDNMSLDALKAPSIVARYEEGPFDCIVSEIGRVGPDTEVDEAMVGDLIEHYWSLEPPAKLTAAYRASHQLLHERLTPKLVTAASLAVDNDGEAETFDAFQRLLPRLRRELRAFPLYVLNSRLDADHVYRRADGSVIVANWGRWSLEPIGSELPEEETDEVLAQRLDRLRAMRPSLPKWFGVEHLKLATDASRLERRLAKGAFKRALSAMEDLVASEMFAPGAAAETADARSKAAARRSRRRLADVRRGADLPLAVEGEG